LRDWHEQPRFLLLPLVRLCTSSFPQSLILTVEGLKIDGFNSIWLGRQDNVEFTSLWQDLLRPFTAVKDLYLGSEIAPHVALALQGLIGESVTELFPALQNIFLKEPYPSGRVPEGIEQFVAARQLTSHPISVSCWKKRKLFEKTIW